VKAITQNTKN